VLRYVEQTNAEPKLVMRTAVLTVSVENHAFMMLRTLLLTPSA
jgi:hypothetical protein